MSLIINIANVRSALPPPRVSNIVSAVQPKATPESDEDTVELSGRARRLAYAVERSTFRLARVRAIRTAIASGTYETPERIDGTVSRLLDVLG